MIRWNIDTERDLAVAEFFSLPADREELMGDGEVDTDDAEMDRADERAREMRDELRAEHERQIDDDVRRAAAYYEDPRD